jgi:hypothetical protein
MTQGKIGRWTIQNHHTAFGEFEVRLLLWGREIGLLFQHYWVIKKMRIRYHQQENVNRRTVQVHGYGSSGFASLRQTVFYLHNKNVSGKLKSLSIRWEWTHEPLNPHSRSGFSRRSSRQCSQMYILRPIRKKLTRPRTSSEWKQRHTASPRDFM